MSCIYITLDAAANAGCGACFAADAYWSWLPLASVSSSQTISQSQCIFVFIFSVVILEQPFSAIKLVLVLLCVVGVGVLTYGDDSHGHDAGGSASDGGSASGDPSKTGSMRGDLLLLLPSICNALYAVEWKRLVPGVDARDSLVGLGTCSSPLRPWY